MFDNDNEPEVPTTALYIPTVINRTACSKHKAEEGIACYFIFGNRSDTTFIGVCNKRARRAGFNHPISAKALRLGPSKK